MPIYEYSCENCGDDFECLVFRTDEPVTCPQCGKGAPKRKMSSFGFSVGGSRSRASSSSGSGCAGCTSSNCASCS